MVLSSVEQTEAYLTEKKNTLIEVKDRSSPQPEVHDDPRAMLENTSASRRHPCSSELV
jgi:hypothetical protein